MKEAFAKVPFYRPVSDRQAASNRRQAILRAACLSFLLSTGSTALHAQTADLEAADAARPAWQELPMQLPAIPQQANLLEFYVSETATQIFAIDPTSLSAGTDGVVRYTLVSRSAAGAVNISYEGIRCESFEKKVYAFGHKDGSWTRSRRDRWETITGTTANRQHAALARDYFCSHKVIEGDAGQIVARLRDKRSLLQQITR